MPRPLPPHRKKKDYFLPFLIIVALGVIALLSVKLWGLWSEDNDGSSLALSGKAELSSITGAVEVYLPASSAWKITTDPAELSPGESVRTGADGSAVLTFNDGSAVNLANSSELELAELRNSITRKTVELALARGAAAIAVGADDPDFSIASGFLKIHDADGKFLLQITDDENIASALDGGFVATVLDPQNSKTPELKNFVVESGKTIEISEKRVNLLRIGAEIDLVKSTPDEISSSEIYRAALGAVAENSTTELSPDKMTTDAERDILPAPFVTTGGGNISAVTDPVAVAGKVSPKIVKVTVAFGDDEAFELSKFEPNSGEWNYNASRDFGNLEIGVNNYSVIGYDEAGNATPTANFQIRFNPEGVENLAEETPAETETATPTDGVPEVGESTFPAPTVTEPADGATITESPIHFTGTAPAGTAEILVNEYKLTSFAAGETNWKYNAAPDFGNLESGENEFEVVAVSESGDRSSVTIKITYSPEE